MLCSSALRLQITVRVALLTPRRLFVRALLQPYCKRLFVADHTGLVCRGTERGRLLRDPLRKLDSLTEPQSQSLYPAPTSPFLANLTQTRVLNVFIESEI